MTHISIATFAGFIASVSVCSCGAGDFGEQPTAALSGFFNAQSAVPGCKGAVPGWEARGTLHAGGCIDFLQHW